jgi:hypothetical protein
MSQSMISASEGGIAAKGNICKDSGTDSISKMLLSEKTLN